MSTPEPVREGPTRGEGDSPEKVERYRPALFFTAVYILSWTPWLIAANISAQHNPQAASALNLVGLIAPAAVALLMVLSSRSAPLKTDFLHRLFTFRRIRLVFVGVAVTLPFMVTTAAIAVSLLFGGSAQQFQFGRGAHLLMLIMLTMVVAPILEEIGWHGYGVDSLRTKTGALPTTVLFAILWSLWHAPLFFVSGTYQHQLATSGCPIYVVNFFVSVIPAAFIANWFYYRNGRSIVMAVLVHAMLNGAAVLLDASQFAKCIATLIYAAIAVALVVYDTAVFRQRARNFVTTPRDLREQPF